MDFGTISLSAVGFIIAGIVFYLIVRITKGKLRKNVLRSFGKL